MKLAEAVLHEMPNIHAAIAAVGFKRNQGLTAEHNNGQEGVQALANFAVASRSSVDTPALPSTNHHSTGEGIYGEDLSSQLHREQGFQINSELEYSVEHSMVNVDSIDPVLSHDEWMAVDYSSPPHGQLASPALSAIAGRGSRGSVKAANSYSEQDGLDGNQFDLRWQESKSPQAETLDTRASTTTPALQASSSATSQSEPFIQSLFSSQNASTSSLIAPVSSDSDEAAQIFDTRESATDKQWSGHRNPLLTAITLGNLEVARLLLRSGAKLDVLDPSGKTVLHCAVEEGDARLVAGLLELGTDVLTRDFSGRGVLHTAVQKDNLEMVELILEWCESHCAYDKGGSKRTEKKRPNDVKGGRNSLLRRCIDAQDGRKITAVHDCVLLGRVEILKVLLEYGADVNIGCN